MAEIRGRRRPDSNDDQHPLLPPSILRSAPSNAVVLKKTRFSPDTVFHCRHLRHRRAKLRALVVLALVSVIAAVSCYLTYDVMAERQRTFALEGSGASDVHLGEVRPNALGSFPKHETGRTPNERQHVPLVDRVQCDFRTYPSTRLYGRFNSDQPDFLSDATYIRGQLPIILNPATSTAHTATKLCINTTLWDDSEGNQRRPFTDGQNPSVVSLNSNPYGNSQVRLDHKHLEPIAALTSQSLDSLYIGISCFGNGQCKFGFTPEDVETYRFSTLEEVPNGKRAVLSIHSSSNWNDPFPTLLQTVVLLERDANYGTNRRALPMQRNNHTFVRTHQEFDDPRFFFHLGRIWLLYRNGPLFGYNDQIHNPIHFEKSTVEEQKNGISFKAFVKASETVTVCCGRNIALISEETVVKEDGSVAWVEHPSLKALTWVDPVTVVDVSLGNVTKKLNHRRLDEVLPSTIAFNQNSIDENTAHRKLNENAPRSNIHGTNGYMIPLSTGELLGIAHFHRPEHRQKSQYALHGHHYTHVFFTISKRSDGVYHLKRLSNEFIFQAQYSPMHSTKLYNDGDIIQFASGLDLVGGDEDGTLIVSYGINDCEGAIFTLPMKKLMSLLIEVQPGQEVIDLMAKISQ